jgi:hypothetical protein
VNALYLPELWSDVRTAAVPAADQQLIDAVLDGRPAAPMERRTGVPVPAPAASGGPAEIQIVGERAALFAGTVAHLEVAARNTGTDAWAPVYDEHPVRLAYRWYAADGETLAVPEGLRTSFGETVRPGEQTHVMLAVAVPDGPGTYVLEVDIVQELVRWFDCPARMTFLVDAYDGPEGIGLARPRDYALGFRSFASSGVWSAQAS